MANRIQIRRDTAANWTSVNPTLSQGEAGLETDTNKLKYGDGVTAWTGLPYISGSGGGNPFDQTLDTTSSVTFANLNITNTSTSTSLNIGGLNISYLDYDNQRQVIFDSYAVPPGDTETLVIFQGNQPVKFAQGAEIYDMYLDRVHSIYTATIAFDTSISVEGDISVNTLTVANQLILGTTGTNGNAIALNIDEEYNSLTVYGGGMTLRGRDDQGNPYPAGSQLRADFVQAAEGDTLTLNSDIVQVNTIKFSDNSTQTTAWLNSPTATIQAGDVNNGINELQFNYGGTNVALTGNGGDVTIRNSSGYGIHVQGASGQLYIDSGIVFPDNSVQTTAYTGGGIAYYSTSSLSNGSYTAYIDASGNLNANMFLAAEGPNGSTGYSFQNDGGLDTGMFSTGDGLVQFYANAQEVYNFSTSGLQLNKTLDLNGNQITDSTNAPISLHTQGGAVNIDNWGYPSNAMRITNATDNESIILQGNGDGAQAKLRWHETPDGGYRSIYSEVRAGSTGVEIINSDWSDSPSYDYHWKFNTDGSLTLPNGSPILFGNGNAHIQAGMGFHISSEEGISLEAVNIGTTTTYSWYFSPTGEITFPDNTIQNTAYPGGLDLKGNLLNFNTLTNSLSVETITPATSGTTVANSGLDILLMNFNDPATPYNDMTNQALTLNGGGSFSNTETLFGSYSYYNNENNSGDYIGTQGSSIDFRALNSSDFTIDFGLWIDSGGNSSGNQTFVNGDGFGEGPDNIWFGIDNNIIGGNGTLRVGQHDGGYASAYNPPVNQWLHIGLMRRSGVYYFLCNGVTEQISGDPGLSFPQDLQFFGGNIHNNWGAGYIANFRVANQAIFAPGTYTLPVSSDYDPAGSTLLPGGPGTTTLKGIQVTTATVEAIRFADNTVQTTAFTGSTNPFNQSLNTGDQPEFNSIRNLNILEAGSLRDVQNHDLIQLSNGSINANSQNGYGIQFQTENTNQLWMENGGSWEYDNGQPTVLVQTQLGFADGTVQTTAYPGGLNLKGSHLNYNTATNTFSVTDTSVTSTSLPAEGLLILDGATDTSTFAQTLTFTGGAATSTAINDPWSTGQSLIFCNGGNVEVPYDSDMNFGSGDFTLDFWIYALDDGTYSPMGNWNGSSGLLFNAVGTSGQQQLYFYGPGPTWNIGTPAFNINEWHHIAVSRSAGVVTIYLDGVAGQTHNSSVSFIADETPLNIGNGGGAAAFNGYMTGVRVVDHLALYTGNFTPPVPANGDYALHTFTVITTATNTASLATSSIIFPDTTVQTTAWTGTVAMTNITGNLLTFPANVNSTATIDYSQDSGQFFIIKNSYVGGQQSINLDTDDGQVRLSSQNNGGTLYNWDFRADGNLYTPGNIYLGGNQVRDQNNSGIELSSAVSTSLNHDDVDFVVADSTGINLTTREGVVKVQTNYNNHIWQFNEDGTLTFPDASVQTTAYRPIFAQGRLTTDQSISQGTDTTVTVTADIDPLGLFDTNTVVIATTGTYEVSVSVLWAPNDTGTDTGQINTQIHRNGDQVYIAQNEINNTQPLTQTGSVLINCAPGDNIYATVYTSGTNGQTVSGGNGTVLSIRRI